MGFSGDDRRKMNKEMWDRNLPPVEVPPITETNDYKMSPGFTTTHMNQYAEEISSEPHRYTDHTCDTVRMMLSSASKGDIIVIHCLGDI